MGADLGADFREPVITLDRMAVIVVISGHDMNSCEGDIIFQMLQHAGPAGLRRVRQISGNDQGIEG